MFGLNTATYKIALGHCLVKFADEGKAHVSMAELAEKFFDLNAERLEKGKPQLRHPSRQTELEWPRRFPSDATYARTLTNCDAEELARVIAQVLLKAQARETSANELASG